LEDDPYPPPVAVITPTYPGANTELFPFVPKLVELGEPFPPAPTTTL
jgi:hypothetical protein